MPEAVFYIFGGLPGAGKSSLARALATHLRCVWLRIDTIEQALRDLCKLDVEGEGYRLAYRVAEDNLKAGVSVVSDSCNPLELTRHEWREVANRAGVSYVDIEVICSDANEHRKRIEERRSEVPGLRLPTWQQVLEREYHPWREERIVIDTAGRAVEESIDELLVARLGL